MQRTTLSQSFIGLAVASVLALCIAGTTIAGIQGSGLRRVVALGRIAAVGHITVNGVEYSTTDARVSVDGVATDLTDLRVGQVVTIAGSIDAAGAAAADQISFVGDVRGVITAVDRDARTFAVLNQVVRVTDETLIDGGSATGALNLQVGTAVEASGFQNSAGELVASRVDAQAEASVAQVRGAATGLDAHGHSFRINELLVDYDDAQVEGHLAEGATVVVQGELDRTAGILRAERIDIAAQLGAPGEKGDLEGIVTSFVSDAEFELNGQRIVGDEQTHYVLHGGELGPDAPVHVSGRFSADALVADKVEIKKNDPKATQAKKPKKKK